MLFSSEFGNLADALHNICRTVRKLAYIAYGGNAAHNENCIKLALYTGNYIGIHSVAYDNCFRAMSTELFERMAHDKRVRLSDEIRPFARCHFYGRNERAAGGNYPVFARSRHIGVRAYKLCPVKDKLNCGQVRGPVQLGFARSVDPIVPQEVTITRVAITTEADAEKKGTEMGRKYIVPYGLYRAEGYVSANLARKTTGFSDEDLELLWTAILNMFELDHSAARGKMAVRELIVFKHDSELGNAPAYKLFDLVKAQRKPEVTVARSYSDYQVTVDESSLPAGVTCTHLG